MGAMGKSARQRVFHILCASTCVVGLGMPSLAASVKFEVETHGSTTHPSAANDSFASGVVSEQIDEAADHRFWTPANPPATEALWNNDANANSWWEAQSGDPGVTAKGKSKAGFKQPGSVYVMDPRIQVTGDLVNGTGSASARAGGGGSVFNPSPDNGNLNLGGLGMGGLMVPGAKSDSSNTAVLVGLPGGTFQLDVSVTATSNSPTNTSSILLEVLIDNILYASGYAELSSSGLFESGLLAGVFNTPVASAADQMSASLLTEFTLPEDADIVPEPGTLTLACIGISGLLLPFCRRRRK